MNSSPPITSTTPPQRARFRRERHRRRVVVADTCYSRVVGPVAGLASCASTGVTTRTRLRAIDHVTSQTGTVLPIEALVRELRGSVVWNPRHGAHAPGMLPLDSPPSVRPWTPATATSGSARQRALPSSTRDRHLAPEPPTVISGRRQLVADRSIAPPYRGPTWMGRLPDGHPVGAEAIRFMGRGRGPEAGGGARDVRPAALRGLNLLRHALGIDPPCPDDSIVARSPPVPAPPTATVARAYHRRTPIPLQDLLLERSNIEAPRDPVAETTATTDPDLRAALTRASDDQRLGQARRRWSNVAAAAIHRPQDRREPASPVARRRRIHQPPDR